MADGYLFSCSGGRAKARYRGQIFILSIRWSSQCSLRRKPPNQNDGEASSPHRHARYYSYHSHYQNRVHHSKRSTVRLVEPLR
ncbi:hypothetical protein MUK42_17063 [Musa troglodytarum]|uniref:Uncharacterized protein n=1 Tax=Musa troglodytarum TaxID=320322 RepID=A0A9E7KCZ9_9LILI|nr:hypothetical protein MUK42_17063 [Musa troglodytarum]